MTFADSARRLAGMTTLVLGWRPPAFWEATPAELASIFHAAEPADAPMTHEQLATLMEREADG